MRPPARPNRGALLARLWSPAAPTPPSAAAAAPAAEEEVDDSCVICGNDESDPFDLIVFCDGCDISVCQSCYSIAKVPEGEWRCRPCAAGARDRARGLDVTCALCERAGGALERTMCGSWAHTACCQTLEEVFFVDLGGGRTAASLSKLFPERRNYSCSLCPRAGGTCILCPRGHCKAAFHPMCARERAAADGLVTYVEELSNGQPVVRICCAEHSRKLGGKPPTDVRRPKSASALGADGGDGRGAGELDRDAALVTAEGPVTTPRVLVDPSRPRRKRGRLIPSGRRFVDACLLRPSDTAVLFEKAGFERFARSTARARAADAGAEAADA